MPKETAEMKRLKAENQQLKAENAKLKARQSTGGIHWAGIWRSLAVIVLIVISVMTVALGNLFFWTGRTVVDTDRFVSATQPILHDPTVQDTIALYTTNQIFDNVDVEGAVQEALPPRAEFLAPQLTAQLRTQTDKVVKKAVSSDKFLATWDNVQRKQHDRLITFIKDYKGDGEISLNDVYNQLSASLSSTKLSFLANKKLPPKVGSMTLVNAKNLPTAHKIVTHIDTWRVLAVLLFVVTLALAVWISRRKRRTLYLFSVLLALMMLATLIALRIVAKQAGDAADAQYADGVSRSVQILVSGLRTQTIVIFLIAIVMAFVAWVSGQSRSALVFKDQAVLVLTGRLHNSIFGEADNKVTAWAGKYKRALEWLGVAVVAIILLTASLSVTTLIVWCIILLVYVIIIEVIGGNQPAKKS
jgi:hypothetical protein